MQMSCIESVACNMQIREMSKAMQRFDNQQGTVYIRFFYSNLFESYSTYSLSKQCSTPVNDDANVDDIFEKCQNMQFLINRIHTPNLLQTHDNIDLKF